ncbi:hypothetical protein CSUB01_05366 [Colletotrichum sublineola]|uniref:Uncharacterized protein n=1 Tax=Colletotrichum sublineola TaxID=1173701 RepID=A0A066XP44_COLSU|nr:hypothetical protein CSUB01_05366 [Colletotrichum sublineola]
MLFSKTFLLIAAAVVPSVMAGCKNAPFQGTCLSCTMDCQDAYGGPGRQESLQRMSCHLESDAAALNSWFPRLKDFVNDGGG